MDDEVASTGQPWYHTSHNTIVDHIGLSTCTSKSAPLWCRPLLVFFMWTGWFCLSKVEALQTILSTRRTKTWTLQSSSGNHHQYDINSQLEELSMCLQRAGDLTSEMASKLPNWFSSKEGLTGESPAVFGAGGMALRQAGESLAKEGRKHVENTHRNWLAVCLGNLAGDLANAACQFEPIGIGDELEHACDCLEGVLKEAASKGEDGDAFKLEAGTALQASGASFQDYGILLCAEDKASSSEDSAGRILSRAGQQLHQAGAILISMPWSALEQALSCSSGPN